MSESLTDFLVKVGHIEVRVTAANGKEAIDAARRKMCNDMPRLWDVIAALEASRFEVELAEGKDVA